MTVVEDAVYCKEIRLSTNNSLTSVSSSTMILENKGTGDPTIVFKVGNSRPGIIGINNSSGDDDLEISKEDGQLAGGGLVLSYLGTARFGSGSMASGAKFSVNSTNSGFAPPRMTAAQVHAISTPAAGLIVYNSTSSSLMVYTDSWKQITAA